jgi:hypothetical protein
MARPSSLSLAKNELLAEFTLNSQSTYTHSQLARFLSQHRSRLKLAQSIKISDLIVFLEKHGDLKTHKLQSEQYGQQITRYSWGKISIYELALSIKKHAFFSHATAAKLNGLIRQDAKAIYLNVEQSPKPKNQNLITQDGIDRAFSTKQRQSNLIYTHNSTAITMISGKNTGRLGVEEIEGPDSKKIWATNLERTLIDIVVRPTYAGGPTQLLKAYRAAKDRVRVEQLVTMLKELDYSYPYHQAIGFLMEKARYPQSQLTQLRALGLSHDFYLAHGLQRPKYSKDWRLHFPDNF